MVWSQKLYRGKRFGGALDKNVAESRARDRINSALQMYALSCPEAREDLGKMAKDKKAGTCKLAPTSQAIMYSSVGKTREAIGVLQQAVGSIQVDRPFVVRNLERFINQDVPVPEPSTLDVAQLLALLLAGSGEAPLRATYPELEKQIMANTADTTLLSSMNDQLHILGLEPWLSDRDCELRRRIAARQSAVGKGRAPADKAAGGTARIMAIMLSKARGILDLYRDGGSAVAIQRLQTSCDLNQSLTVALSAFMTGDLTQFDPQVGDDLCELRTLLLTCLRARCQDLPILRFLQRERTDLYALTIWACYLLTYIPKNFSRSIKSFYTMPADLAFMNESIYVAMQRFLAAVSVMAVRQLMPEGLKASRNLVLSTNTCCASMPFYCSIKAFLAGAKMAQCPVVSVFRRRLNGTADYTAWYCMFVPVTHGTGEFTYQSVSAEKFQEFINTKQDSTVIVYEWNNFPAGTHYERTVEWKNNRGIGDDRAYVGNIEKMIQTYGIENLILMDAAQHDQFIKVPTAIRDCLRQKIEGSDDRDRDRKAASIILTGIYPALGAEYDRQLHAARQAAMNEERKVGCQQDQSEITLIVDHVFLDTLQRYIPNLTRSMGIQ